jgi:integrase/recombinase XerD
MNERALNRPEHSLVPIDRTVRDANPSLPGVTWHNIIEAFLSDYRGATRRSYRDALRRFLENSGVDLVLPISTPSMGIPDEDAVKAYRDSLLDTGHSPHTINAYMAAIRAFYRFLHNYVRKALRTGQISATRAGELQLLIEGVLAVGKVRASNAPGRLPTTVDQSRDLLQSIPTDTLTDLRDRAMVALIIGCGLRRIEIVRIVRRDLIHRGGQLVLKIQQKGHHAKDAYVVIWPDVERMLRPWLTQSPFKNPVDPLFPSLSPRDMGQTSDNPTAKGNGHPAASALTPRSVSRIVRKRLDAVGLSDHSTHSLRHAFATIALSSDTVDVRDVQSALGHSTVTTTERYIHQSRRLSGLPEKAVNDLVFSRLEPTDTD